MSWWVCGGSDVESKREWIGGESSITKSRWEPEPSPPCQGLFPAPTLPPTLSLSIGSCHLTPSLPFSLLKYVPWTHLEVEGADHMMPPSAQRLVWRNAASAGLPHQTR